MLDIIIPVLNEASCLKENRSYYKELAQHARLIFVDGGSTDDTPILASVFGKVLHTSAARSLQKNYGAQYAEGSYFLFMHVDCRVPLDFMGRLPAYLERYQAGCFTMRIEHPYWVYRIYEWAVNTHARLLGAVDADLGLFIKRDLFETLGGFDSLILMDDIAFSKKLKKHVTIKPIFETIQVSPRRWQQEGFLKTLGLYTCAYLRFWLRGSTLRIQG